MQMPLVLGMDESEAGLGAVPGPEEAARDRAPRRWALRALRGVAQGRRLRAASPAPLRTAGRPAHASLHQTACAAAVVRKGCER